MDAEFEILNDKEILVSFRILNSKKMVQITQLYMKCIRSRDAETGRPHGHVTYLI